jgi:hypothetical protein
MNAKLNTKAAKESLVSENFSRETPTIAEHVRYSMREQRNPAKSDFGK